MRLRAVLASFVVALAMAAAAHAAPLAYLGGPYMQDFDGLTSTTGITVTLAGPGPHNINGTIGTDPNQLTNSGMEGWTMSNFGGSGAMNTEFRAQDGSQSGSAGRGVVSFGAAGSSDRALGTLATSNQVNRFGLSLVNSTGSTLTQFSLSFTGEQWRRGNVPDPGNLLEFSYATSSDLMDHIDNDALGFTVVPELSFTSPNLQADPTEVALDGNEPANQVALSYTVKNLQWAPGELLLLRWTGQDVTGQDDGLAIDNLSFVAVPEPASWLLTAVALVSLAVRRQRG
jgi:large repetitive protein